MTDAVWQSLLTIIPPTIGSATTAFLALLTWRQSVVNSIKADNNSDKIDASSAKSDTLIEKAVEIHTLTNSNLSKVTSANEVLTSKVDGLERLISSMLASTTATKLVAERQALIDGKRESNSGTSSSAEHSLQRIDDQTAEIAQNTSAPMITTTEDKK